MQKFYGVVVAFGLMLGSQVKAADSSSGCGLGWQLLTKNSLLSSFSRSVTHAILPNSFSMTFGTSGCAQHSIVKNERKAEHFVEANFNEIQNELAIGPRTYVAALAQSLGCDRAVRGDIATVLRQNYDVVYPYGPMAPAEVVANMRAVIDAQAGLAEHCG